MAHSDLIEAFNTCIDRLNAGDSVEDCLRDFPHYANTLRPMLEIGQTVQYANPPIVAGARARVRTQVMRTLTQSERAAPPRRKPFAFSARRLTLAAATLLIVAFVTVLILTRDRSANNVVQPTTEHIQTEEPASTPITPTESATATGTATVTATTTATTTATDPATEPALAPEDDTASPSLTATPLPTDAPSSTPSGTPSRTPTRTPTNTATTTRTRTPQPCLFTVEVSSVNLREGPGTGYAVVGYGFAGETFPVQARHTSGLWYLLDGARWIAAEVGVLDGDCSNLNESNTPYLGEDNSGGGDNSGSDDDGSSGDSGDDDGNSGSNDDGNSGGDDDDSPGGSSGSSNDNDDDDDDDDDSGNDSGGDDKPDDDDD